MQHDWFNVGPYRYDLLTHAIQWRHWRPFGLSFWSNERSWI